MKNNIKFADSISIDNSLSNQNIDQASAIIERNNNVRLKVTMDATHSGVLTNLRVYPALHVSKDYKSFVSKENGGSADYDKPVLLHHASFMDPIGRIVKAQFTPLKSGDAFTNDYLSPEEFGGKGSGVVTVDAIITDTDAIKKIIDSRYLTVSAGHQAEYYVCSVCGDSIMDCKHMPGARYDEDGERTKKMDGNLCYVITGPMTYREVSFVNEPAQPSAKVINFNWTDGKDSWNNTTIAGLVHDGKEAVRTLSLCDEEGELSLLDGKLILAPKKTIIAVSPAIVDKLRHAVSSTTPNKADVITDVRQPDNGKTEGKSVEQNLDKAKNLDTISKEDKKMDKQVEDLQKEIASLKDQLSTAQTKLSDSIKEVEARDSQIKRLTTDATEFNKRVSKSLAVSLASLKIRLKKPGSEGIDSKEKLSEYVEKLATRSMDSLQDSIEDLLFEVEAPKDEKNTTSDLVSKDKITDPTSHKGDAPNKAEKKVVRTDKGVDLLSKSLGIE